MRNAVQFIFNGEPRRLENIDPNLTVLRYLREDERAVGTKEGCAEGDCGACTAVVADLDGERLRYRAVNTCIQFVGMLDGKALITVEKLKSGSALHPVQQAMVEEHGSQCGFCTPGFVMSIFAGMHNGVAPERTSIDEMLAGNLCRCTGYTPIIKAAEKVLQKQTCKEPSDLDRLLIGQLKALANYESLCLEHEGKRFIAPRSADELARTLLDFPGATVLAGGTDLGLYVTKKHQALDTLIHIDKVAELRRIDTSGDGIRFGAAVTYQQAREPLAQMYPAIGEFIGRIGAVQVRNLGTLGGNIANGSPIGDTPPALIAAGATLTLRRGSATRTLPLEQFFIAYGKQDRAEGEFIESIWVPRPAADAVLKVYKISKRIDQDISSVCGAFCLRFEETAQGHVVSAARIAFGGMAGTPVRAVQCEAFLTGRQWNTGTVEQAAEILSASFQPLDDARASAEYRNRVAGNLLRKYYLETESKNTLNLRALSRQARGEQ